MTQKIARWDIRETAKWAAKNKGLAVIVSAFLGIGGVASVMGILKVDIPVLNWSLAIFFWGFAAFLIRQALFGKNEE